LGWASDVTKIAKRDHYRWYEARGPKVGQTVTLDDQLGADTVRVERPYRFCNPVACTSRASSPASGNGPTVTIVRLSGRACHSVLDIRR